MTNPLAPLYSAHEAMGILNSILEAGGKIELIGDGIGGIDIRCSDYQQYNVNTDLNEALCELRDYLVGKGVRLG